MSNGKNGATSTAVKSKPQFVTNEHGDQIGVFLDIAAYRRLIEELEDSRDLKLIEATQGDERIPWADAKARLKQQGKL